MAEADAEDRDAVAEMAHHVEGNAGLIRGPGAGRDDDGIGADGQQLIDGDCVVAQHPALAAELADIARQVVDEGIVVIDQDDHFASTAALARGAKAALARAFKSGDLQIPPDLPEKIENALARILLDRLGLELRAGSLILGTQRIAETARGGAVALLLHARDASEDGHRL